MPQESNFSFCQLKEEQKILLNRAKEKIEKALENDSRFTINTRCGNGGGQISDMSLFKWIPVFHNESGQVFWITLFYNYLDTNTGNYHTDYGRVCFVRPVKIFDESKPLNNAALNEKLETRTDKYLIRANSSWGFPAMGRFTQKDGDWLTVDDVLSKDFDMNTFINDFTDYINNSNRSRKKK